ncbi:acetylxylan esterase [Mucilaginibacter sp. HD30]
MKATHNSGIPFRWQRSHLSQHYYNTLLAVLIPLRISPFLFIIWLILAVSPVSSVAQNNAEDDIVFRVSPSKKDALFNKGEKITYNIDVKNNLPQAQAGTVGYTIMSMQDKVLNQGLVEISLKKKDTKAITLSIPSQPAGFYKVNLLINVTEYDDTLRRVVGVDVKNVKSQVPKPTDFERFWQNAMDSLELIPMSPMITLQPEMEIKGIACYLVELKSWNNVTIRGWLTMSKNNKPNHKLPVWLVVPGYGGYGLKPIYGSKDLAVLVLNVRGQGNSRDKINPSKEGYLTTDLENRYKCIFRGAIMDVIRGVDFITSRSDLDEENIVCSGASMGGYLSIASSSIDRRIKICSAFNPNFSDFRSMIGSKEWPMKNIEEYSVQRHIPLNKILTNLDYYDLKNFASNLKCNSLMGISLLDNLAPPQNSFVMVNSLTNKNKLFVYPNLAHEVPQTIFSYLSDWIMDVFGMF